MYRLRTDDRESLKKIVNMVDSSMKIIAQNTRSFAGSRIAVLAALKIAEDYYQLKRDYDELLELLDENK
ncbi:MAG: cell division protein ZapA [Selenomonadaceae bacterium]|nr:cell division protein ZapA [Selenomonadaceae bacterium]